MEALSLGDVFAGLAGLCAVFAMLYALACRLGFDVELHNLRVETMRLRCQYEERLAQIRAMGGDVNDGPG